MAKKTIGRPPESPNRKYDVVDSVPTICRRCGSARRTPYDSRVERIPFAITFISTVTDRPYNVIEYRVTKCLDCQQARKDKTEVLEERETSEN